MELPCWLLFLPQLPASPSSLRVLVWRRLRAAGAVGMQSGVWVLPCRAEHEVFLRDLAQEVERQSASATIFAASPLDPAVSTRIIEQSRADRDREYDEFCERCAALRAELDRETERQKFTFAELEENEQDFHKLESWLARVTARDFFNARGAAGAHAALAQCQQRLARYSRTVYVREGLACEDTPQGDTEASHESPPCDRPEGIDT